MRLSLNKTMLIPLLLAAHAAAADLPAPTRRVQYVMGTLLDITAYGPGAGAAVGAAFEETARLDRALSIYKMDSDASRLNASAGEWFACGDALWEALTESKKYAEASGGAFDPTILPVLKNGSKALPQVGFQRIQWNPKNHAVRFANGMGVDFGGIGKGIALDHAAKILRQRGINSALLNFGGQIYALGAPPGKRHWEVHVEGSEDETFLVTDASVSSSGNSQRPGHIASPFTGERIHEDYSAVVVAPSATQADAWSTAVFVLGPAGFGKYPGCSLIEGRSPRKAPACLPYLRQDNQGARS